MNPRFDFSTASFYNVDWKIVCMLSVFTIWAVLFTPTAVSQIIVVNDNHRADHSRMSVDARQLGTRLEVENRLNQFEIGSDVEGIVHHAKRGFDDHVDAINRIASYVYNGGRAVIFVLEATVTENLSELISDRFDVGVINYDKRVEGEMPSSFLEDSIFGPNDVLCSSWSHSYRNRSRTVSCGWASVMFVPLNDSAVLNTRSIDIDGEEKVKYVHLTHGIGEVVLVAGLQHRTAGAIANSFFSDTNYTLLGNQTATQHMMRWLLGQ